MPETSPIPVLRWRCDIARPAPRALQIYRGETARLECLLTLQGDPATIPAGASALIAWQSRDMGASWYTAPATVDAQRGAVLADFTPAMDSGAAEFRAFLRVDGGEGSGICYRAAALLQMMDSPGAVINEIPIPPRVLDFATIEVLNAPYWTKAEADARFASVADATLNGRGFGPWTVTPDTVEIVREYDTAHGDPKWVLYPSQGGDIIGTAIDDTGQTTVTWTAGETASIDVTATRTALPGYVLGSQTEKPLASEAEAEALRTSVAGKYAKPSGGIPKTDLAQAVQTSLDKADAALPTSGGTATGAITIEDERTGSFAQYGDGGIIHGNNSDSYALLFPAEDGTAALTAQLPLVVTGDLDLSTMAVSNLSHTYADAAAAVAAGRDAYLKLNVPVAPGVTYGVLSRIAFSDLSSLRFSASFTLTLGQSDDVVLLEGVFDTAGASVELTSLARAGSIPDSETWTFTLSGGGTVTKNVAVY